MAAANKTSKKNPSLVGFKPTSEDLKKITDLMAHYDKTLTIPGAKLSQSDLLRIAIDELYKSVILPAKKGKK